MAVTPLTMRSTVSKSFEGEEDGRETEEEGSSSSVGFGGSGTETGAAGGEGGGGGVLSSSSSDGGGVGGGGGGGEGFDAFKVGYEIGSYLPFRHGYHPDPSFSDLWT